MKLNTLRQAVLLTCMTSGLPAYALDASSSFEVVRLGLVDAAHTRSDGYQSNNALFLNEAGQAAGYSSRFSGNAYLGSTAWLYNGSSTQPIGFVDAAHTRADGYQDGFVSFLNNAGQAAGRSLRFNGNVFVGQDAWLYNGSNTLRIGLVDAAHTGVDGYQNSNVSGLNEAGHVLGSSERYNSNGSFWGSNAWLYNGSGTQQIGLVDVAHTRADGYQYSRGNILNSAGQVAGHSNRYKGNASLGQNAWLYNGSSTQQIGLVDAAHTRADGYQNSVLFVLNNGGHAVGISERYDGYGIFLGKNAWLYNGSNTQLVGLVDAAHTSADGYQDGSVSLLNNAGQAAGSSSRFSGNVSLGQDSWLYNGSSTQRIGLVDAAHTSTNGTQDSTVHLLNNAGQAAGYSSRFNGNAILGRNAWLYNGSSTQRIGLVDAAHTRSDGYQDGFVRFLNEAGQAVGSSSRFSGNVSLGQDAWFYDDESNKTIALTFSVSTTGYADSSVRYLGDDGLVLGSYLLFAGDLSHELRAFAWSLTSGFLDLGLAINGDLGLDWSYIAHAYQTNDLGQIIGNGQLANGSSASVLLTPVVVPTPVPEPESYAMVLAGLGLVAMTARRRFRVRK